MNREPVIRPLPSPSEFQKHVDVLITPEFADREAKAFAAIVLTVANPEDDYSWELANEAARYAFTKTAAFEDAFRDFSGFPETPLMPADRYIVHADVAASN